MDLIECYRQGQARYFADAGEYLNPYTPGSPEHNEFERGWMQALRRDDAKQIKPNRLESGYSSDYPADAPTADELLTRRYRALKG
jgi:hypothetical protein